MLFILGRCQTPIPKEIAAVYNDLPDIIDFNFHIKPIISDRCYKCHGPDENARKAEFRLDLEEVAFAKLNVSGGHAFVKGNPGRSVAWERTISVDPEFQMPPPESNLSLSTREKALITKWIKQGAEWKEHWAFSPPQQPVIPQMEGPAIINPIDNFILAKLNEQGLSHSEEADKERLIRRVSFDLRGLPPSLEEIDAFLKDDSPKAYETLVDKFLDTDAHAERMAMDWLDVARFGDTQGMHFDAERYNWPWRDWVIRAFNENMPYDAFITQQIAGDLLPNATRDQKLATAFHRNHPTSSEGGIPDEEYRQKYVQDRTNTTATAFLGLTLECATCHDHKFDPISQKEYYQMTAFFNNLKEIGMVNEFRIEEGGSGPMFASGPVLLLPDGETETQLTEVQEKIAQIREQQQLSKAEVAASKEFIQKLADRNIRPPKPDANFPFETLSPYKTEHPVVHRSQNNSPINQKVDNNSGSLACGTPEVVPGKIANALRSSHETDIVFLKDVGTFEVNEAYSAGAWVFTEKEGENQTIMGTSGELGNAWRGWDLFFDSLNRPSVSLVSIRPHNYMQITSTVSVPKNAWHHILFTYDGSSEANGLNLYIDGKKVGHLINNDHLYGTIVRRWDGLKNKEFAQRPMMVFRSGRYHTGENGVFTGSIDEVAIFRKYLSPAEVAAYYTQQTKATLHSTSIAEEELLDHYLHNDDKAYRNFSKELSRLLLERLALSKEIPEIMVMEDMPTPRKTFVLNRGQYDAPTDEVEAGTPETVMPFPDSFPKNRLGLAMWLVDEENPLTARVAVNRYWQMIFGRGIVETTHDFGTQGALPSHPELLDWLALNFVKSGWDVRELLKTMVMSATYRQSSIATLEHRQADPKNIYLAHAPGYRLQAEMIRDNALAASGLLTPKVGGPSVKPYQPEGVWDFGVLASGPYEVDSGEDLYRRSMYTYLRRTTPHPAMTAFDAPNRLTCVAKRENTNTPLQALVLLNDPQFVEAARVLAQRMQLEGGKSLEEQAQYGFRLLFGRKANPEELELIRQQYQLALDRYQEDPTAVTALLAIGEYPLAEELDQTKTAALAIVTNALMNFDEAYMKR